MLLHRTFTAVVAMGILASLGGPAEAAIVAYDGFEAGGSAPGAGQYVTGTGFIGSGTTAPGDALHNGSNNSSVGQDPETPGFSSGSPWDIAGFPSPQTGFASSVYYQVRDVSMGYTDVGGNQLITADGSLRHLHEASPDIKTVYRPISATPTPGDVSWYSALLRYESEDDQWSSTAELRAWQGIGTPTPRYTSVGITSDGELRAFSSQGSGTEDIGPNLTEGQDHFILVRLEELPGNTDSMHVWVDPALDAEPALTSADASIIGDFVYVSNNASYPFNRLQLTAFLDNSGPSSPQDFVFFDEFRLGQTFADVTPYTAIPEPSTFVIAFLGLFGLVFASRRLRKR